MEWFHFNPNTCEESSVFGISFTSVGALESGSSFAGIERREDIEKQNEASLRLARQKQELELERQELEIEKMREEQERLRKQQERLRKEPELRVLELEEENRKRLAEATLAELELREDLSDLHVDFHDTLSRLSAASRRAETERINEWINNSPNVAKNNIQSTNEDQVKSAPNGSLNTYTPVPLPQTVENQAIAEATTTTTGATGGLILTASVPQTLPSTPPVPIVQQVAPPTGSPAGVPAVSVAPLTIPMTGSTTTTRITNVLNQTTPHLLSMPFNPTVSVPVSHVLPNLSAWTNPPVTTSLPTQPRILLPSSHPMITATTTTSVESTPVTTMPVMPVTHGGTVFYVPPSAVTVPTPVPTNVQPSSSFPSATAAPFIPSGSSAVLQPSTTHFSLQDVAQLLASTKKDNLPEWKLSEYNGDPIHWHEWFGQFKSAMDSAQLSDDVKLTYLKTLVTGKAKVAIAEFAYCGAMYKDALKTLERKFGQPQAVVTAYVDKLANIPPVKMHNSESIISYSATVSSLVGVFRSLNYVQDLSSATLLGQAVQKLPPNMKEAWSMHTVKRSLDRPTLIDFNDWLKDKAEAHERMKTASGKIKGDENVPNTATKTKTTSKVFAATTSTNHGKAKTETCRQLV